jgi:Zn-finger nucleic acid-binding protein
MAVVKVGGVEIDRCTSCGGMWFDAFESDAVKGAGAAAAADTGSASKGKAKNEQGKIECPKCHTRTIRMVDREQPHIWFESCPVCYGRFFDAGEFRDVAEKGLSDLFRRWKAKERPLS